MKKFHLFIIVYSIVLVAYTCIPEFLVTADVNSFFVDFDSSRQSVFTITNHHAPGKTAKLSAHFDCLYISSIGKTSKIYLDADLLEKSEVFNHGLTLTSLGYEGTPVLTEYSPAIVLSHFPSEAYRLRI